VNERFRNWLPRSGICELLVAIFLFKALVPMGYMPARDADGALILRLCSVATLFGAASPAGQTTPDGDRHAPDNGDRGLCPHVCATARQRERATDV
jgi:hypothetical protein